jgi:hypothetical protein
MFEAPDESRRLRRDYAESGLLESNRDDACSKRALARPRNSPSAQSLLLLDAVRRCAEI